MASLLNIKSWFKTGLKPTQQHFWDTLDSFWHKDENIPVAKIDGIDNLLNQKANKSVVDNHLTDSNVHANLFSNKVDKEEGKGLSSEDFTTLEKEKLAGLGNTNQQFLYNENHYALANQTAYQKIFETGELTVEAGKTYLFRMEVSLYQFSTFGRAVSFSMLGTANVSDLHLNYTTVLNGNTPQTYADIPIFPDSGYFTNGQMGWSGTVYIKGVFTATVDGTLIPAIKFDALPGSSLQATSGSYFLLKKLN